MCDSHGMRRFCEDRPNVIWRFVTQIVLTYVMC